MSEKTSITVSSINGNAKTTKSITDINPNASDAELITLTNALYGMTTNSVSSASKVTKREIIADGLYPLVITTTIDELFQNRGLVKVDETHWTLNVTTLAAQQDKLVAFNIIPSVNGTVADLTDGRMAISCPMGQEEFYTPNIMLAGAGHSAQRSLQVAFMVEEGDIAYIVEGEYIVTIPEGTYNGMNYGAATITVTVTKGA